MIIGGWKHIRYAAWIFKKQAQVIGRTHLSHLFAIALGGLVIFRERDVLWSMLIQFTNHPMRVFMVTIAVLAITISLLRFGSWELVILFVTVLSLAIGIVFAFLGRVEFLIFTITVITVLAAGWELVGNKLTTSPQEIRFLTAMQLLLSALQKLTYGEDRDLEKRLDEFLKDFLEVTSKTLCGKTPVDAGFMGKVPRQDRLELLKSSSGAKYPPALMIPLVDTKERDNAGKTGPAGVAYDRSETVYMPFKHLKRAWPIQLLGESYEPSDPAEGWVSASSPEFERFCSVLCSPVAVYSQANKKFRFGVLNYSTKVRDPFVDRDFAMSECFSNILAQAMEAIRREALQQATAGPENVTP
jgi:hypothetical protein